MPTATHATSSGPRRTPTNPATDRRWFERRELRDAPDWLERTASHRMVGDPLADAVFAELMAARVSLANAYPALLERAEHPGSAARALLDEMRDVPSWADFDAMRRGARMVHRNFPMMMLALTYGALPLVFVHRDSAAVFGGTGHFAASVPRRLQESSLLFFGVNDTDALLPDRSMWRVCLRVRLIHAAVRQQFSKRPEWDTSQRGVPINALQTAAGPAFFGTRLLDGMRRLGAVVDPEEALGHKLTWRYVTYLLGVPSVLIGATQDDQDAFDDAFLPLVFDPDDRSRELVRALLEGLRDAPQTRQISPSTQVALIRCMLGDAWSDGLGVPTADERALRPWVSALQRYSRWSKAPLLEPMTARLGAFVLRKLSEHELVTPGHAK